MPIFRAWTPCRATRTIEGSEAGEHADHQRDRQRPAEHRAEQQRELDVAHAHPLRVRESRGEQESGGAEAGDQPLDARMQRRLGEEHDRGGRHDDAVRDDPVLEIGRGHGDERGAEERRHGRVQA